MCNISFLISTNRPYNICAKRVVDGIEQQGLLDNNEVIVCSNDPIQDNRIVNIEDTLKINGTLGFNQAAKASNGDILVVLCDDHEVLVNTSIENIFNNDIFKDRKYKILTMATHTDALRPAYLGPIPEYPETYIIPRTPMCRFPILTRETYVNLGNYIFHPKFNLKSSFFPDNYLSYFLYMNNEEVVQTKDIILYSYQNEVQQHNNQYFDECLNIYMDLLTNLKSGDPYVS